MLDLFADAEPWQEPLAAGAVILHRFAFNAAEQLIRDINDVASQSPFRQMVTPGGYTMSVAMTNCGRLGWTTHRQGYLYSPIDPQTNKPWPAMPQSFHNLCQRAATAAGYPDFQPDACLINRWGGFVLVARVYKHMATLRETEDKLYTDFQTVLEGRKELTLNRERAEYVFNNLYIPDAQEYRHHIIRADTFHLSAVNWSNIMMLGAIGLVFWMANSLGWADTNVAATYSLTLLFLRTPLLSAVGALPTLLTAQVAFNKLNKFALAPFKAEFPRPQAFPNWQTLELRNVTFAYQDNAFSVGPINLTIKRGELLFLIGGNGSGKSTLAMLLTGLYQPQSGEILLDGKPVSGEQPEDYRKLFSAVFTDVWLFDQLLGPEGQPANPQLVEKWLAQLKMAHKLELSNGRIVNLKLSKGQKKRVALLLALAEERDIILLDEWAADQDPHFRREFYQVLLPLMQEMGKTIFAISHDDHYFIHADRLLEMRNGQLSELTGEERDAASRDAVARTA